MSDTAIPDSVMQKAREVLGDVNEASLTPAEECVSIFELGAAMEAEAERQRRIIALAILAAQQEEREACAQIADAAVSAAESMSMDDLSVESILAIGGRFQQARQIATAIRAKGQ